MRRDSAAHSIAVLGFILAFAGSAWANGEEFFAPPANSGKIDLLYFGRIKDNRTGRSVTGSVDFMLTDKATGLSFPFTNDKPGHYRSPDIGTGIKEIGEQIDVNAFVVDINVRGYKRARITRLPRKAAGTVELDVRLDPVDSDNIAAAGLNGAALPPYTWSVLIGALVLLVIVKRTRTFV